MSGCDRRLARRFFQCARLVTVLSIIQAPAAGASQLATHNLRIMSVKLSPNGKTFITGSADAFTRLWDVGAGSVTHTVRGRRGGITSVAFSPDSRMALTGSAEGGLTLIDVASGKELRDFSVGTAGRRDRPGPPVLSVAFSPDGLRAVSGGADYKVRIWSVKTGREVLHLSGHRGPVKSVSYSGDGKLVLSAGGNEKGGGCFKWWEITQGREVGEICDAEYLKFAAFSPDGRKVLTGGGSELKLWDLEQRRQLVILKHGGYVDCGALSNDGKLALSAGSDGVVKVWDVVTGRLVKTLEGHDKGVFSVSFSSDDRTALSGDGGGDIKLWDLSTGVEIRSFPSARVIASVARTSDEGRLPQRVAGGYTPPMPNSPFDARYALTPTTAATT